MKTSAPHYAVTTAMIVACCASPTPPSNFGSAPSASSAIPAAPGSASRDGTVPATSSSSTASSPTTNIDDRPGTKTSPFGWWLARSLSNTNGLEAVKLAPDALWLVSKGDGITLKVAVVGHRGSSQRWHLDDGTVCTRSLVDQTQATLDCERGGLTETLSLGMLQPEQEAELEQRVAAFGPAPTLCEKAIRCCEVASPLLSPGGPCDIAMQMGSPPQPDHCLGYLRGNRMLFDIQKKKLPDVCL